MVRVVEDVLHRQHDVVLVRLCVAPLAVVCARLEVARDAHLEASALAAVLCALLGLPARIVGVLPLDERGDLRRDGAVERGPRVALCGRARLHNLGARGRAVQLSQSLLNEGEASSHSDELRARDSGLGSHSVRVWVVGVWVGVLGDLSNQPE